jgi:hypothetical protein
MNGSGLHEIWVESDLLGHIALQSIKSVTRKKKSKSVPPIRRVIEIRNVPLPSNLPSFLSLPENKEDFAFFLATELIRQAPEGKVVIT